MEQKYEPFDDEELAILKGNLEILEEQGSQTPDEFHIMRLLATIDALKVQFTFTCGLISTCDEYTNMHPEEVKTRILEAFKKSEAPK